MFMQTLLDRTLHNIEEWKKKEAALKQRYNKFLEARKLQARAKPSEFSGHFSAPMTLEQYRIFDSGLEDEDDEKDVIAEALAHERKYRILEMQ